MLAIDGVRGVAIAVVVAHNASFVLETTDSSLLQGARSIVWGGWVGVLLFFVLSGFLITGILLESAGSPRYFRTFYVRRTLRIFPLYYVTLAVAMLLVPLVPGTETWAATAHRNQVWFWTYLSNWTDAFDRDIRGFNHFWSLAVEEQFYLVWPIVVLWLGAKRLRALCIAMVVAGPLIRLALHLAGAPELAISEFTVARMDALAAGALLAVLWRDDESRAAVTQMLPRLAIGSAFAAGLVFLIRRGFQENDLGVQLFGHTPVILICAWLLVVGLRERPGILRRALESRALRELGKYSYAMYVFHWPIHILLSPVASGFVNTGSPVRRLFAYVIYTGVVAAVSLVAAMVSWTVLESPFLRLKDRLAPRPVEK